MANQAYLFLVFALNGIFIGLLFDLFRILRKSFKTTNFITYIEDILFWILTGMSVIFSMYNFSDGNLRWFMFFGIISGFVIYILTLSKLIIKIVVFIIKIIKKVIYKCIQVILKPFKFMFKMLLKPISSFFSKIYLFLTKKTKLGSKKTKKIKKTKNIWRNLKKNGE